jgi:hypothetical protein
VRPFFVAQSMLVGALERRAPMTTIVILNAISSLLAAAGAGAYAVRRARRARAEPVCSRCT